MVAKNKKTDKKKKWLTVEVSDYTLIRKAKAKASILGIDLKTFISRLIEDGTKDIFLDSKTKKRKPHETRN